MPPVFDYDSCTRCGACVEACTEGVLAMDDGKPVLVHPDKCSLCGLCMDSCPACTAGAIKIAVK